MGEDLTDTDDLQTRENALAEAYAAENGGTGLSYYNDDGYNYDDSSALTDVDYQPANDESSQYTSNYTGAEDFDPVNRENDNPDADDTDGYNDDGDSGWGGGDDDDAAVSSSAESQDDTTEETDDDNPDAADGENDESEDADDADDDDDDDEEDDEDDGEEQVVTTGAGAIAEALAEFEQSGQVTLPMLNTLWDEISTISALRPAVQAVNESARSTLQTVCVGSMITTQIKLYNWIRAVFDGKPDTDFVGALLGMASKASTRMVFTATSAIQAIFCMNWIDPALISVLPMVLNMLLVTPPFGPAVKQLINAAKPLIEESIGAKKAKIIK